MRLLLFVLIYVLTVNGNTANSNSLKDPSFDIESKTFIDKSLLLRQILQRRALLITCPKNFGKSSNLAMTRLFLQIPYNESGHIIDVQETDNYKLFTNKTLNLHVSQNEKLIEKHCGKYPTLYLKFSSVQGATPQQIIDSVNDQIIQAVSVYNWLRDKRKTSATVPKDWVLEVALNAWDAVLNKKAANHSVLLSSLEEIVIMIENYFSKPVMVFIDDYDAPITRAISYGINATEINQFIVSIIDIFVRMKDFVELVMVTGATRMFKNGLKGFNAMNTVNYNYFLEQDNTIVNYFGFTEADVDRLLDTNNKTVSKDEREKIKKHFNGYQMKTNPNENRGLSISLLYNPVGVLKYIETNTILDNDLIDDRVSSKLITCLRHRDFFTNVSQLLLRSLVIKDLAYHLSVSDLDSLVRVVQNNCTELPEYSVYIIHFLDYGYATWSRENREVKLKIANTMARNKLIREYERFYLDMYGIQIRNTLVATNIRSILNSNTTTDDMTTKLSQSLQELLKPKLTSGLTEVEFKTIIAGAFYSNLDFYKDDVPIREVKRTLEAEYDLLSILKIPNHQQKSCLIIHQSFKGKLDDGIREATKYVPLSLPDDSDSSINLVKYLAINFNANNNVEVAKGENLDMWKSVKKESSFLKNTRTPIPM